MLPSGVAGYPRTVEHAALRPLPSRPSRPADPDLARRYVAARLPALDAPAATALALVELARVDRDQAARELGLSPEQMGATLARARKELRRSRHALAGSGWCEKAERLISDRLDGDLATFPAKRLDAHLRNCPRCVEHELRLTQAIDELAEGMPAPAKPAAAVRLVLPPAQALPPGRPPEELEEEPAPSEPAGPSEPDPAPEPALRPVPAPVAPPSPAAPEPPAREAPLTPAAPSDAPARPPVPRPLADPRPVAALVAAFTWHIAFALAIVLAVATIAITVIGIGGGQV